MKTPLTRRSLLGGAALGGAAWLLRDLRRAFAASTAAVDPSTAPYLIFCAFEGGWDQLLCLDPRDATKYGASGPIHAAYERIEDATTKAVLAQSNGTGLVTPAGSNITFGPAVGRLSGAFADLCVVRGLSMDTLTHEVGRRYMLTGKLPRGVSASGSALSTAAVGQLGDAEPIPNLVVGLETYNEGQPNFASGLTVTRSQDILVVLKRLGIALPPSVQAELDAYAWSEKCGERLLDGEGAVTTWLDSREKAVVLASGDLAAHFDFSTKPSAQIQALYDHFGLSKLSNAQLTAALSGGPGQAMIAAQAITRGVSRAVSIRLANNIDHHDDDWASTHATALRSGFEALADLIAYLKATPDAKGKPFWDRCVVVACSDFARAPTLNARGGRDHHLASSCLLAGKGVRGNVVVGGTDDAAFSARPCDVATGLPSVSGVKLRPADVHATLLKAAGLGYAHLENQSPQLISAALRT